MEIPTFDRAPLMLMCGLQESEEPPPALLADYFRARRIFSRVAGSGPLPPAVFVSLGLRHGLGDPRPEDVKVPSFADHVRGGKVKRNDPIVVEWRGERKEVTFLSLGTDHRVRFLMDGKKGEMAIEMQKAHLKQAVA